LLTRIEQLEAELQQSKAMLDAREKTAEQDKENVKMEQQKAEKMIR
jgi:hypothetical protein